MTKRKKIIIAAVVLLIALGWYLSNQNNLPGIPTPLTRQETILKGNSEITDNNYLPKTNGRQFSAQHNEIATESSGQNDTNNQTADKRQVIQTGNLDLTVRKAQESAANIQKIAREANGFTEHLSIYEFSEKTKKGTITIRVPADKFKQTIDKIKAAAENVESETINSSDVTSQHTDLKARLKNLRAEEQQYQKIMEQAEEIEDILNVARQLSNVRGRIERLEAQLKSLDEKIEMSSITINLTAKGDVEVFGIHWQPLAVVKQSSRQMLQSLTGYVDKMIIFLFALPAIILWLITWGIGLLITWKLFNWTRRKWFNTPNG